MIDTDKYEELAKEADEDYQASSLSNIFVERKLVWSSLDACCERPLFTVSNQNDLVIYFDRHGEIVSDVFHVVPVYDAYCTNCGSKVKTPQSYIDAWIEDSMEEEE